MKRNINGWKLVPETKHIYRMTGKPMQIAIGIVEVKYPKHGKGVFTYGAWLYYHKTDKKVILIKSRDRSVAEKRAIKWMKSHPKG